MKKFLLLVALVSCGSNVLSMDILNAPKNKHFKSLASGSRRNTTYAWKNNGNFKKLGNNPQGDQGFASDDALARLNTLHGLRVSYFGDLSLKERQQADVKGCILCNDIFEDLTVVTILPCQHVFCTNCVDKKLVISLKCPDCNADIVEEDCTQAESVDEYDF